MQFLAILVYAVVSAVVVFLSIKLSTFVDLLDKRTNVSGAFLGGILLAAVTSLPEMFTSITATIFVGSNEFVIGNILGSNLFNMALFFVIYGVCFKRVIDAKVNKCHVFSLIVSGLMYITVIIASFVFDKNGWLLGWFNPLSILILVLYVFSIVKTPKEEAAEEDDEEEVDTRLTVKQIIVLFALFSVLLIGASIGLTYCVDWITNEFSGLGDTFAGALFLGVATSLPELTATITLCKKRNYNAAIGDIVGSSVFNFFILSIADLISFGIGDQASGTWGRLYQINSSSMMLIISGAFSELILLIVTSLIMKKKLKNDGFGRTIVLITGILTLCSYITFLVLSNIL